MTMWYRGDMRILRKQKCRHRLFYDFKFSYLLTIRIYENILDLNYTITTPFLGLVFLVNDDRDIHELTELTTITLQE